MGHRRRRRPVQRSRSASSRAASSGSTTASSPAIEAGAAGQVQGRHATCVFNLKNGGVGVGKINPAVPAAYIKLMNSYKAKIIAGTLKVPAALK